MDADLFIEHDPPRRVAWLNALRQWRPMRWLGTLKARLAIGGLLMLLVGMSITAWHLAALAERDLLQQVRQREHAEAHRTAAAISHRLTELQAALDAVAPQLDAAILDDRQRLTRFFETQPLLREKFGNVFAIGADGRIRVFVDSAGPRFPDTAVSDRVYYQQALAQRRTVISDVVAGRLSGEPVVIVAHPLVRDGVVVGVLGGSLRLASRDLLQGLAQSPGDDDSALVVVADRDGTILKHPERARLLTSLHDEPTLAQAQLGQTTGQGASMGAGRSWSSGGVVVATAEDQVAGWQVWRAVPADRYLAPLLDARRQALRNAAALAVGMSVLLFLLLAWQLRPLARLERRAAGLLSGDGGGEWPEAQGEIGRLARTLRHVWAERTQMESFNAQVLQKLGSVMAAAPVGLAFTRNQRFELVSAEFCQLVGRSEADLVGQPSQLVFCSNEDFAALEPQLGQAFAEGRPYAGEWPLLRADGSRFWALLRARPVSDHDPSAGAIWSINDISEQIQARRQLEHAARHDALTGVVNRTGFEQALQDLFDGQPGTRPASLVMIDLDHFKPINDTAGHAAGDAMLVAVAQAIASRVRATDLVVRLGGDEFALLLPHCDHERALAVAGKVQQAIGDLALKWEAHTLRVGASLGVAELGAQHESPAQWLAQADAACYEAKRAGRGTVRSARTGLRVVPGNAA
jgi:diguanylate cyclase (GGDEF)-like protein/PAS domain S-box-containing protein